MAFPRVGGHPDYTGSGASRFIPEIWSGKLNKKFYATSVVPSLCNTDYEGEIKAHGDKVIIRQIPTLNIRTYNKGMALNYERPESTTVELLIDKGKYFAFTIDHVDKFQSDLSLMDMWSSDAAEQMKISVDTDVLADLIDDGHASNLGATAGAISANINLGTFAGSSVPISKINIVDNLVGLGQVLDEQNVPENDRWVVIPAWAATRIKTSDLKDASLSGDGTSMLRNGRIGRIDRFTLYSSNLLYTANDGNAVKSWGILFGQKTALTWASQITETETLKAESTFGDLVRGLNVYGYKVIKPESLGMLVGSPA
jgi:hypothetical protein